MILELWLSLLALSLVVMLMGYFTNDEPYLPVGLFFFFLLGLVILTGNLEYPSGDVISTSYTYDNGTLVDQTSTVTYQTTPWSDTMSHRVGWTFTILSICGFGLALFNMRRGRGDEYID